MSTLAINTVDGVRMVTADTLDSMTAYVMLEQEQWFEQEVAFIRALARPGMHALDIGANHGAYSLVIAAGLEEAGHVWSFEPTSVPYGMLSESVRINDLNERVTPLRIGLSDRSREARIQVSSNSELNSLAGDTGVTELVHLRALDEVLGEIAPEVSIDFVKLDAEGEELRIVQGGENFFARQSPLVMFEIRHGAELNTGLWDAFVQRGYDLYRHVPGLNLLVPVPRGVPFEPFELNLFAAKPDRAAELAARGLLVSSPRPAGGEALARPWLSALQAMPFAQGFLPVWSQAAAGAPQGLGARHTAALDNYFYAHDQAAPPAARLRALMQAVEAWHGLWPSAPGQLSLGLCLARACADLGQRAQALAALTRVWQGMQQAAGDAFALPFLPPVAEFDARTPRATLMDWLIAAMIEAHESWRAFSSYFTGDCAQILGAHLRNPDLSMSMRRRFVLHARRTGQTVPQGADEALLVASPHNRNPGYWRRAPTSPWALTPALAGALGNVSAAP